MVTRERVSTVSAESYERVALRDPEGNWELLDGTLREKPGMSTEHNDVMSELARILGNQLDRAEHRVRPNSARLHVGKTFFIPDIAVILTGMERAGRGRPGRLEIYDAAVPLVIEIWSPTIGRYDVIGKLARYQERGDAEIWYIHPYERTITIWRRRPDGTYDETSPPIGPVEVGALPGVTVDLAAILDDV